MKREIWGQITVLEMKQNRKNFEKVGQNGVNKQCLQIIPYYASMDVFVYEV